MTMASGRSLKGLHSLCCSNYSTRNVILAGLRPAAFGGWLGCQQVRHVTGKHYDPRWKKLRSQKVLKIDLPDWEKMKRESNMSPDEFRSHLKKEGRLPPRDFQERNIHISSTSTIFEAYVPPEGDGRVSLVSGEGAKQRFTELEKKGKSVIQVRKIRKFEENFDVKTFPEEAIDIYIEAHKLLTNIKQNEDRLHELVTEKAFPEMTWALQKKTYRWDFIESLEPPRVVHVRTTDVLSKENIYAQVTVRFHSKQMLALYDQFGRLMLGSEKLHKDSLEYVVFEKHLANEYGTWRMHGKIIPDWMPPRQHLLRTTRRPAFEASKDAPAEDRQAVAS